MDSIQAQFCTLLQGHGIEVSDEQLKQFERYYEVLVDWNEKMNLTGITEREQVYIKHFYDSISLAFHVPMGEMGSMADIGSGAGFPGIPLKICYPHLQLTIVDSLNKRIQFLQHVVTELGLSQVQLLHGRAEDLGRQKELRDAFDLVTARAVARMAILNEFCLPFTKPGGLFVAMKGSNPVDEVKEAARSLSELKGKWISTPEFSLPLENSERHLVIIQKTAPTPKKYPRKPGTPVKMPLI